MFDLSTKEMLAGVEGAGLDVALTVEPDSASHRLKWTPLIRTPWQLAVNRNHPLARRSRVTPVEVAREPLLVFCQRDYPEYWNTITGWLRGHRVRPRIAGEYDGVDSLMAAVELGLGVAIVTVRAGRLVHECVRLQPLSDAHAPLSIAAGFRVDRADDKQLAVFIEEVRNAAQNFV